MPFNQASKALGVRAGRRETWIHFSAYVLENTDGKSEASDDEFLVAALSRLHVFPERLSAHQFLEEKMGGPGKPAKDATLVTVPHRVTSYDVVAELGTAGDRTPAQRKLESAAGVFVPPHRAVGAA